MMGERRQVRGAVMTRDGRKGMRKGIIWSVIVAVLCLACRAAPTATPIPPATPTAEPVLKTGLYAEDVEVLCSTDNPAAAKAYNTARQRREAGDWAEAESLYRKAIELDPGYCDAMDNLGQLLRASGRSDEAIDWYLRSLQIHPDNLVAHQNLAAVYQLQGRYQEALDQYGELLRLDPDGAEAYYGQGVVLVGMKRYAEAIVAIEAAYQRYESVGSPYIGDAVWLLAQAHFALGQWTPARSYLERLQPAADTEPLFNYMLGVCWALGDAPNQETARTYLERAAEMGIAEARVLLEQWGR